MSLEQEVQAVSDHHQVVDRAIGTWPIHDHVRVADGTKLSRHHRRNVDALTHERLNIRARLAEVRGQASLKKPWFA